MSVFFEKIVEDGTVIFNITTAGYVLILILILLSMLSASYMSGGSRKRISSSRLILSLVCMAIAFLLTNFTILQMPQGGEVTLCSMFFITFIGYLYGPRVGISSAIAYGCLQLITDPYIVSIPQLLCDYILAFGVMGVSGFLSERKGGLQLGYLAGVAGRFLFSVLSGVIFFGEYAPEGVPPIIYSIIYNGTYIGAEAALTIVIISVPPVTKALQRVRQINQNENREAFSDSVIK